MSLNEGGNRTNQQNMQSNRNPDPGVTASDKLSGYSGLKYFSPNDANPGEMDPPTKYPSETLGNFTPSI